MKEVFELKATKENGVVEISAKGVCSKDLLFSVVASILRNVDKGEEYNED